MSEITSPTSLRPAFSPPTFSPMVVLWMVLAGVFSFSAFVVLSAYAPDMRGGSDSGAHALSRSAVGYAGIVRLLRDEGEPVVISRRTGQERGTAWSLVVATPAADQSRDTLWDIATKGPTLIVTPKWGTIPNPLNPAWVNQGDPIDAKPIQTMLAPLSGDVTLARRGDTSAAQLVGPSGIAATGPIEQLQTFAINKTLIPLVSDQRGGVVLAATADRRVYFLSDPDLLANHGLANLATARIGNDLIKALRKGDGPIAFDVSLNGFGAPPSLLKLAFSPPYLGATLCLVAAGLLIGLHAASRFGAPPPVERTLAFGKRTLADNSAALIRLAGREPHMAGRYLDLNRNAVVKALGAGRVPPDELDAFLDRVAEKSGVQGRLSVLAPEARAAKTRADLTQVARGLYHWRLEMTRERR